MSIVTLTPFSNRRSSTHTPDKSHSRKVSEYTYFENILNQEEDQSPLKPKYRISKKKSKSVWKINTAKVNSKLNINQLNDLINKRKVSKIVSSLNPFHDHDEYKYSRKIKRKSIVKRDDISHSKICPEPSPLRNELISLTINNYIKLKDWKQKALGRETTRKAIKRSIIKKYVT